MSAQSLIDACKKGNLVQVKAHIMTGDDVLTTQAPLEQACIYGHLEVVKLLIDEGASAQEKDFCALRSAAKYDRLNIVKFLLEETLETEQNQALFDNAFLTDVCAQGALKTLEYLLKNYSTINPYANDSQAFKWALSMHNEPIIDYLIYDYRYSLTDELTQWLRKNHEDVLEHFFLRDNFAILGETTSKKFSLKLK